MIWVYTIKVIQFFKLQKFVRHCLQNILKIDSKTDRKMIDRDVTLKCISNDCILYEYESNKHMTAISFWYKYFLDKITQSNWCFTNNCTCVNEE